MSNVEFINKEAEEINAKGQRYLRIVEMLTDEDGGIDPNDVCSVCLSLMTGVLRAELENNPTTYPDLDVARQIMDELKSKVLGALVEEGWE